MQGVLRTEAKPAHSVDDLQAGTDGRLGAMLGGLLLGVIESLASGYIGDLTGGALGSNYRDIFAFLVLVLVLVLRPSGLMGQRGGDRA